MVKLKPKKLDTTNCWQGGRTTRSLRCCWQECSHFGRWIKGSQNGKSRIARSFSCSTLGCYPKRNKIFCTAKKLCTCIHSSMICNRRKLKTAQMVLNWWMDEKKTQNVHMNGYHPDLTWSQCSQHMHLRWILWVNEGSQALTVLFHCMATQRRPNYEVKTQCVLGEGWGWREVNTGSKRGPFGVMKIFISWLWW